LPGSIQAQPAFARITSVTPSEKADAFKPVGIALGADDADDVDAADVGLVGAVA
jgi:hypothetical protein